MNGPGSKGSAQGGGSGAEVSGSTPTLGEVAREMSSAFGQAVSEEDARRAATNMADLLDLLDRWDKTTDGEE